MSEKYNFSPFKFDEYSRRVREYFRLMNKIRNDVKLRGKTYDLRNDELELYLEKLDILIKDKNSEGKAIQDYFDEDINNAQGMNESFVVFEKYYKLLEGCYGKNPEEIVKKVDMKSKLERLQDERT